MKNKKIISLINNTEQQCIILKKLVLEAIELANKKSDESEVIIMQTTGIKVSTRYGKIENIEFNNDNILKITVYKNYSKGSSSSTDCSKSSIIELIENAVNIANYTSPDFSLGLPKKQLLAFKTLDLNLFHPIELDIKNGIILAANAELIALNSDDRIINSEGGFFSSHFSTYVFGNSHGLLKSYNTSMHSISCSVIAKYNKKMERNYAYTLARDFNDLKSPKYIGKECAKKVLSKLNPIKIKTMEAPILFSSEISYSLFKHFSDTIHGKNVYRKSTLFFDSLGTYIFPNWLSIKEYPHLNKGIASAPFDNEGVKTKNLTIVKNGILNTWLLDNYTANKLNLSSTGHSGGIYNWIISHQNKNFFDLLKIMEKGLIVTELMGSCINIVTGDYSRGASGFWVENGIIKHPVSEVTIAGNLKDMFLNILYIGNDIELKNGIQSGSVLLSSMKIAGL